MKLGLVSCTKSKKSHKCKASEMYNPSPMFRAAFSYASKTYDAVAILSAKYGLLLSNDVIKPYEATLKTMTADQRKQWAQRVLLQMRQRLDFDTIDHVFFHAGKEYREHLISLLERNKIKCSAPLAELSIGRQLQWYKKQERARL